MSFDYRNALRAALLAGTCLVAGTAHAETIRQSLAAAYDHNPALNSERAGVRASDEQIAIAKSGYRPTVSGQITLDAQRVLVPRRTGGLNPVTGVVTPRTTGSRIGSTSFPFGYGITINQSLFRGFQTLNSVNQAEAAVRAAREQLTSVEQDVLFNAASAYADIIFFQELVQIRRRSTAFLREQVRAADARLEVGEGTRTDVAESRAQLALAEAGITTAEAQLAAARAVYLQFVGRPAGTLSTPTIPDRLIPGSVNAAISIAMAEHPAIRGSQHLVDAQAFAVKTAEGQFLPSLDAQISASQTLELGEADGRTTSLAGGLRLTIPIYPGGRVSAQVRQAKETLGQRRIVVDQTRDQVRVALVAAFTQFRAANQNVASNLRQVGAARLALEGVIAERDVGQRTQLDVLQSQNIVANAQEALATARRSRVVSAYQTLAAMGRLTARRLSLKVTYYDPREHYAKVVDKWYGLRTPDQR